MSLDALTAPGIAALVALLSAVVAVVRLYVKSRRTIVFDAWADFTADDTAGDRGRSMADLLLFHIREIQNAHRRSGRELDLKNPYDDIPAFQQELDSELKAAVELHRQHRIVGPIVSVLVALVPTRPARLRGSIHRFGSALRVHVVLENARGQRGTPQWSGTRAGDEQAPDLVEDLAYEIYLALAGSTEFKDARAFRRYTEGLTKHLAFGETGDVDARERAQALYEESLEREPRNPATLFNLGVLHYYLFEHDRNEEALRCFRRAMPAAQGPLLAQIHSALANVHSTRRHRFKSSDRAELDIAVYHAGKALEIDDGLDVVLKAAAYAHQGTSEALQADARAAGEQGRQEDALEASREAAHHRDLAIGYYRRAISSNPSYYTAHNNLGNLYLELACVTADRTARTELLRASVDLFKQTMAVRPAYHHAYDNLGNAYYELALLGERHLFDHAERYYRSAIGVHPGYAEAENDLAMLYLTPGWSGHDEAKAASTHAQALEHAPDEARRRALAASFAARREAWAAGGRSCVDATADTSRVARRARRARRLGRLQGVLSRTRHA